MSTPKPAPDLAALLLASITLVKLGGPKLLDDVRREAREAAQPKDGAR